MNWLACSRAGSISFFRNSEICCCKGDCLGLGNEVPEPNTKVANAFFDESGRCVTGDGGGGNTVEEDCGVNVFIRDGSKTGFNLGDKAKGHATRLVL
jgi:hypothetical protein